MDLLEIISKVWPILLAFITLVIVLAKMEVRIGVAEEKIKTLFELHNGKK